MYANRILCFGLLLVLCLSSRAQQLTLEEAISIGMKNNLDVLIVTNDAEVAANNNTIGNAGMLPRVDLNASTNFANNTTKQEFSSGLTVDKSGVRSSNINAGVFLTWTLFDGMRMFATHARLSDLEELGRLSTRIQIENTLSEIITSYYSVVRQQQLIRGLSENKAISEERLKIAQARLDIGSGSRLDVLQAKVDLNAQQSLLLREKTVERDHKSNLNRLLARPVDMEFTVSDSIPVQFQLNFEELKNQIKSNNSSLLFAQRNIGVTRQIIRETKAERFPTLDFNASYLFARSQNQAGFALFNQNLGLNYGFTASWTIFNGFTLNSRVKNAKLQLQSAEWELQSLTLQADQQLVSAFRKFSDDREILQLEEENVKMAKEAVDIALERYRIGSSNSLELKEIQQSYQDALVRLASARLNAKNTEVALMKLNGTLVK